MLGPCGLERELCECFCSFLMSVDNYGNDVGSKIEDIAICIFEDIISCFFWLTHKRCCRRGVFNPESTLCFNLHAVAVQRARPRVCFSLLDARHAIPVKFRQSRDLSHAAFRSIPVPFFSSALGGFLHQCTTLSSCY